MTTSDETPNYLKKNRDLPNRLIVNHKQMNKINNSPKYNEVSPLLD